MTGVKITKNVKPEVKEKLGFEVVADYSFTWGVPYPLPDKYGAYSTAKKILWKIYSNVGDLMMFLLFLSNIVELFRSYRDIRVFVTCTGTITYIICFRIKMLVYKKKAKSLELVIDSLHKIAEKLSNNPVEDNDFFEIYQKRFKFVLFLAKGKIQATAGGVCTLAIYEMIHGYLQDSDEKRHLPMFGWYPYDPYRLENFEISCFFQLVSYLSFLLKDVVVDLLLLTILVTVNSQLIYLRKLLGLIVDFEKKPVGLILSADKERMLIWWVKQHQSLLRTIEDLKEITNPYLFYKYISVGIILFFGGILVTSNIDYDLVQQMIVLTINSSNLLQLYIFSVLGDKITENGLRLTENGMHLSTICGQQIVRKCYLYVATKCSRPILIHFGQINPLCVASFGQIVKITFSYFITIVQIRDNVMENTLHDNSTESWLPVKQMSKL